MVSVATAGLIFKGVLLGLGAAVPIGPVNVEIARRALRQGFLYGAALGGGAATVDMTYALVASLGWAPLIDDGPIIYVLGTAGVLLLLYLAAMCFRGAWRAWRSRGQGDGGGWASPDASPAAAAGPGLGTTYVTGLLMNFFNPMILAFWFVILPAMAAKLTNDPRRDLPLLGAGVFVGAFGWAVSFSATLALLGRFKRGVWVMATDAVGGVVLLGFALLAAGRMLRPLLFPG